jgi:hypothetical protein
MDDENEAVFMEWLLEKGEEHGISREDAEKAVAKTSPQSLFRGDDKAVYEAAVEECEGHIDYLIRCGMPSASLIRIRNKLPKLIAEQMKEQGGKRNGEPENSG